MPIEVAVYQAKTGLSELLTEVEAGKTVVITRRGVAMAHLVSSKLPRSSAAGQRQRVVSVMRAPSRWTYPCVKPSNKAATDLKHALRA